MINLTKYTPNFGSSATFTGVPILKLQEVRNQGYRHGDGFRVRFFFNKRETSKKLASTFRVYPRTK